MTVIGTSGTSYSGTFINAQEGGFSFIFGATGVNSLDASSNLAISTSFTLNVDGSAYTGTGGTYRLIRYGRDRSGDFTGRTTVTNFEPYDAFLIYNNDTKSIDLVVGTDPSQDPDGNGLPEVWQLEHFGTLGIDPHADADGDGASNLMEYLTGTDPNDPSSVFRPQVRREGNTLVLPVPTLAGRNYRLLGSENLQDWTALELIDGDGSVIEMTHEIDSDRGFLCLDIFLHPFAEELLAVLELAEQTTAPALYDATSDAGPPVAAHLQAVYFDGLPYKENPTRVFAWLGIPENRQGKVPAVVLVHGGGGTAFGEWVRKWNEAGFAANSIAVEGQTDVRDPLTQQYNLHSWPGPQRSGIYGDSSEKIENQWMYHAVANTIMAHSLLRSLPEVDADQVGVMGISWGGVITVTVMGIDPRFAFAIPVYGSGQKYLADNQYGRALGNNDLYRQMWDPALRMNRVQMPALWLSWPGDQHFPLDVQAATYRASPGPRTVALIPGLRHGHAVAWNRPESYAFAKSVTEEGGPWCRQIDVEVSGRRAEVSFASTKPLEQAVLISTTDNGPTGDRNWTETPASLDQTDAVWTASVLLPDDTTAWFINVHHGDLIASSCLSGNPFDPAKSGQRWRSRPPKMTTFGLGRR